MAKWRAFKMMVKRTTYALVKLKFGTRLTLDWSESQVRDFVEGRKLANQHLCAAVGVPQTEFGRDYR
jgi:hypothetical protein